MTAPVLRRQRREAASVEWRRRYNSYACVPRDCGCPDAFHRDPMDCEARRPAPSTFSLDPAELVHHTTDLAAQGWADWELAERFGLRAVPAA